jgi:exonuclease SbcC
MIPRKLRIRNVCQHEDRVIEYDYGITMLTGRNGCGKSNLGDAAQYFAITGKISSDVTKGEMVRWGSKEAWTEFTFEHAGQTAVLRRNLHNSTVKLELEDGEVFKNANANQYMEDALGMGFDVFYEACWAGQGSLTEILTAPHGKRIAFFQKLADVRRAETLRGIIQEVGLQKLPLFPDRSEDIRQYSEQITQLEGQMVELEAVVGELEELAEKHKPLYQQALDVLKRMPQKEYEEQLQQAQQNLDQIEASYNQMIESSPEEPAAVDPPNTEAKSWYDQMVIAQQNLENFQKSVIGQQDYPEVPPAPERGKVDAVYAELERLTQLLENSNCPTCGRAYDALQHDPEQVRAQVGALRTQYEQLKDEFAELNRVYCEKQQAYVQVQVEQDQIHREIERQEALISGFSQHVQDFDPTTYDQQQQDYQTYAARMREYNEAQRSIQALGEQLQTARHHLRTAQDKPWVSEEHRQQAETFIQQREVMQKDLQARKEEWIRVQENHANLKFNRDRMQQEQQKRKSTEHLRMIFERSREVLHRDVLPKHVMQHMRSSLNLLLARYLAMFETDFYSVLNEDFDFICVFDDEHGQHKVQPRILSGGQQVALAIAFRLAVSDLLSAAMPLLVLDEPTVWLDENNIACVRKVLEKARELTERGVYVQVITHEPALYAAASKVLDVAEL